MTMHQDFQAPDQISTVYWCARSPCAYTADHLRIISCWLASRLQMLSPGHKRVARFGVSVTSPARVLRWVRALNRANRVCKRLNTIRTTKMVSFISTQRGRSLTTSKGVRSGMLPYRQSHWYRRHGILELCAFVYVRRRIANRTGRGIG